MQAVFLVLSPFNYNFNSQKYYDAGDRIYFDYENDLKEIEFLLKSDNKNLLALDKYNTSPKIYQEVKDLHSDVGQDLEVQSLDRLDNNVVKLPQPSRIQEVSDEPVEDKMIIRDPVPVQEVEEVEEEKNKKESPADSDTKEQPETKTAEPDNASEYKYSQAALEEMNWRKLKKIMVKEGMEYEDKESAIKSLLTIKN